MSSLNWHEREILFPDCGSIEWRGEEERIFMFELYPTTQCAVGLGSVTEFLRSFSFFTSPWSPAWSRSALQEWLHATHSEGLPNLSLETVPKWPVPLTDNPSRGNVCGFTKGWHPISQVDLQSKFFNTPQFLCPSDSPITHTHAHGHTHSKKQTKPRVYQREKTYFKHEAQRVTSVYKGWGGRMQRLDKKVCKHTVMPLSTL